MIRFNKPTIGKKDLESVLYCMIRDDLAPGDYSREFCFLLSKVLECKNIAVFNTYFHSFEIIFQILGLNPEDQIIIPSYARYELLYAVKKNRLKPVLVDIVEDGFLPSIEEIGKNICSLTRCIIVPQMFGIPSDLSPYHRFGLPLIEDLDGCIGSKIKQKPLGSFGTFITMSFNDNSIITTGSGGMLGSRNREVREIVKNLESNCTHLEYLMSDFNASLGISQIKHLEAGIEARKKIGKYYDEAVMASGGILVGRNGEMELSYSSYVVSTKTPFDQVVRFFNRYNIPVRRGIEKPLHSYLSLDASMFRNTEKMYNSVISFPIYPTLGKREVEIITKGIRSIL